MKAAIITASGASPVYADFVDPVPQPGESRIGVTAAAVSHVARSRAAGLHYSGSTRAPFVIGIDGVGRLQDGRRVYFVLPRAPYGSMAEATVVRSANCIAVPDELDDVTAAAIANPGMSSWAAFTERAGLRRGETVLVNGATGTAGRLAVQIAKHLGAGRVIATGRDADALTSVAELGADATIPLGSDPRALEEVLKAEFARGIDVVVDYLWGDSAQCLLVAAAKAAPDLVPIRFVQIGSASGAEIALQSAVLRSSAITMMGSGIGSVSPDRFVHVIGDLFRATVAAGFRIASTPVPLAEVERAWSRDDSKRRTVFTLGAA